MQIHLKNNSINTSNSMKVLVAFTAPLISHIRIGYHEILVENIGEAKENPFNDYWPYVLWIKFNC